MLERIHIQNYAIIDRQDIDLTSGLNIITGETGAGKSIILGALAIVLGARAESRVLTAKDNKAVVEATFVDYPKDLDNILAEHDVDLGKEIIMRREILPSGKSRAFINDTPVRLELMRAISGALIDMHQQFESLEIQQSPMQYRMLDAFAGLDKQVATYSGLYRTHQALSAKVTRLENDRQKAAQERDYVEFQLNELNTALPEPGQVEHWESEYGMQEHAEEIISSLYEGKSVLRDGQFPTLEALRNVSNRLGGLNSGQQLGALVDRLDSIILEMEDLVNEMDLIESSFDPDPERKTELEAKLDAVRRLYLKHNVQSEEALVEIARSYQDRLDGWAAVSDELEKAIVERDHVFAELRKSASTLHKKRSKAAISFASEVNDMLHELEMKNAKFRIDLIETAHFHDRGNDSIDFMFAANLGSELNPVGKVASGGELSRLSLCVKSVVCKKMRLPSMVFDEIDAGVSGQVALKMGKQLKDLADQHQVIMITHSPQIAANARLHLKVAKHDLEHRSVATIAPLDSAGRILEVAKMLSGDPPTEAAVLNAKELINH